MGIVNITHKDCNDGFTAKWVVWKRYGNEVEFIDGVYGKEPDYELLKDNKVIITDFSYKRDIMLKIINIAKEVIIYDHHISAKKELAGLEEMDNTTIVFDMDRCGSVITWNELFPNKETPLLMKYVQDRDLWIKELPYTDAISMFIFSLEKNFANWDMLMSINDFKDEKGKYLITEAKAMYKKYKIDLKNLMKLARPIEHNGMSGMIVNVPGIYGSDICHELCKEHKVEFAIYWFQNADGDFIHGIRSLEFGPDVSSIAEGFGGGGHKHAAGFKLNRQLS